MGFFNKNKEKSVKNKSIESNKAVNKIERTFNSGDKVTRQEIIDINVKLDIVNNNCQYACDKVEQIELKLNQVAGRMGL